jgi:hypothetical protein
VSSVRRLATLLLLVVAGTLLPVATLPSPAAHAVAPAVVELPVGGVDARAARRLGLPGHGRTGPAATRAVALTPPRSTPGFSMVGVTWAGSGPPGVEVEARVRSGGRWGEWFELHADDVEHGPDAGSAEAAGQRGGTVPMWVGPSDGVQVRVDVAARSRAPQDVRVSLVDPGRSRADRSLGSRSPRATAAAGTSSPSVVTRRQWGADERLRSGKPAYSSSLKMAFVHHTDSVNTYSPAQAAGVVRGVYAFHTRSRGWGDIGYNFLVDRYGRVYEGRAGGVDKVVIGAHTAGFNSRTVGVALVGSYTSVVPSSAQLRALQQLLAWKLAQHHVDPTGRTSMTSAGGTRYAKGRQVTLNVISGHRDGGSTACPGNQTYARLPAIRRAVRSLMRTNLVNPVLSAESVLHGTAPAISFRASGLRPQYWRWTIRDEAGGLVRQYERLTMATDAAGAWDLRTADGRLVPPGRYRAELNAWSWGNASVPWVREIEIRSPLGSGLVVRDPDAALRVVTGDHATVVAAPLADALGLGGTAAPANAYQLAGLAPAPDRLPDGSYGTGSDGARYLVSDGVRRPVTAEQATAWRLPAPAAVPDALWALHPLGLPVDDLSRHLDGIVVVAGGQHWRLEDGFRRPFTSPAAEASWRTGRLTAPALGGDLALPPGAPLGPGEGSVLRLDDESLGVVSDGRLRRLGPDLARALGYPVAAAPAATAADLDALPAGADWTATTRHPSGTVVRSGTGTWLIVADSRRPVHPAVVALSGRPVVAATPRDLTLPVTTAPAPDGFAALVDGLPHVVVAGVARPVGPDGATGPGYAEADLPQLTLADLGVAPGLPWTGIAHPDGTLVAADGGTWLVQAGTRRPVTPAVLATYRGRAVLPATAADLAVPEVHVPAPPPSGTLVRTPEPGNWLVDGTTRRPLASAVVRRLGLAAAVWQPVPTAELVGATTLGRPLP